MNKDTSHYVYQFLEPNGAMALRAHQLNGSTDNAILFSVVAYTLFPFLGGTWLAEILAARRIEPGKYKRHPAESWPSLQDDHIAVMSLGNGWAKEVYEYGKRNKWIWSDVPGVWANIRHYGVRGTFHRWLGRMLLFRYGCEVAMLRHCSVWHACLLSVSYVLNALEDRRITDGAQLCWLVYQRVIRSLALPWYSPLRYAIKYWQYKSGEKWANGVSGMFHDYYCTSREMDGMEHPFTVYGSRSWT